MRHLVDLAFANPVRCWIQACGRERAVTYPTSLILGLCLRSRTTVSRNTSDQRPRHEFEGTAALRSVKGQEHLTMKPGTKTDKPAEVAR